MMTIPRIIANTDGFYASNLIYYFQKFMGSARNLTRPYHNFRHMFHVFWLCYDAGLYYHTELNRRDVRSLLIAAMYHDFNHPGITCPGTDDLNIERALRGLKDHLHPEDTPFISDIESIIWATEFPYKVPSESMPLLAQILRDADASQALSVAWFQHVVIGLGEEAGCCWMNMLESQASFLRGLQFSTKWAQEKFSPSVIQQRIEEVEEYLSVLRP